MILFWLVGASGAWAIAGTDLFLYWPEGGPGSYIFELGGTTRFVYADAGFVQLVMLSFVLLAVLSDRGWRVPIRAVWLFGVWIVHLICTTVPLSLVFQPMAYQPELGEFTLASGRPLVVESLVCLGVGFPIVVWAMRRSKFFVQPILAEEEKKFLRKVSFRTRLAKSRLVRSLVALRRVGVAMKNLAILAIIIAIAGTVASIGLTVFLYARERAKEEEGRLVITLPSEFELYFQGTLDQKHMKGEKYIRQLPEGKWDLVIRRPGYVSFWGAVVIHRGEDFVWEFPFIRVSDVVFAYRDELIHLYYASFDYGRRRLAIDDSTELQVKDTCEEIGGEQKLRIDRYFIYRPEIIVVNEGLYAGKGAKDDCSPTTQTVPGGPPPLDEWPDGTYCTVIHGPPEKDYLLPSPGVRMEKDHDLIIFRPTVRSAMDVGFYWEGYTWKIPFLTYLRRYLVLLRYLKTRMGLGPTTWEGPGLFFYAPVRQFMLSELKRKEAKSPTIGLEESLPK